jgi:hypothetical protein
MPHRDNVKQILIGQIVLERDKWKLEDANVNTIIIFLKSDLVNILCGLPKNFKGPLKIQG